MPELKGKVTIMAESESKTTEELEEYFKNRFHYITPDIAKIEVIPVKVPKKYEGWN